MLDRLPKLKRGGIKSRPYFLHALLFDVLDQVIDYLLEDGHHLGVGQIAPVDSGRHVQELPISMLPGNEGMAFVLDEWRDSLVCNPQNVMAVDFGSPFSPLQTTPQLLPVSH
jgi:hypothetical protein